MLGGNPMVSDLSILPTPAMDATNLTLSYTRTAESVTSTTQTVEWSTNLMDWTPILVTGDATAVSIQIPRTNAPDGKLFARLKATLP